MVKKKEDQFENIWKSLIPYMTREAYERLSNIKIVHEDLWRNIVLILYQNVNTKKIDKIDTEMIERIIKNIKPYMHRETKIRFKEV